MLPKIKEPIYSVTLPITGDVIKFRPFTVKEEKILLLAKEGNDITQIIDAMFQIINNCVVEGKKVEELSVFELEYLFIMIRSKSIDNTVSFSTVEPESGETVDLSFDITDIKINNHPEHSNKIDLDGTYTLFMRYPTTKEFFDLMQASLNKKKISGAKIFELMCSCMNKVVSENEVYELSEYSEDDIQEFLDDFDAKVIKDLEKFFETMPSLRYEIPFKLKSGEEKKFIIEGLQSFFI